MPTLSKQDGWEARLTELTSSRLGLSFAWGENDCCLWAADAVYAMTGVDFAKPMRGEYRTAKQAAKLLKPYGGIKGYLDTLFQRVTIHKAQRGDVVMAQGALGIVDGSHALFLMKQGLTRLPMTQWTSAWTIESCLPL